jgi:hypothetical protein
MTTTAPLQSTLHNLVTPPKEAGPEPLDGYNGMRGRVTGPDPSQIIEGKLFEIPFTEENALQNGLVPRPQSMAPQVQAHLMGQALDVTALPYSVASVTSDNTDSSAALSWALASMAGAQTDLELGGDPMDLNWKTSNKLLLSSVKNLTQSRERLTELCQGKLVVEQTLVGRITSVLQHAVYNYTLTQEWGVNSILYHIGCDSQTFYIQLHEHKLDKVWDDETTTNVKSYNWLR